MKQKIKLIILVFSLIILIIIFRKIIVLNSINYNLNIDGRSIKIKEVYENNNYYIEINTDNNIYPFRVYKNKGNRKIVNNIYIYSDNNLECVLPIIENKIYLDMMCYKDNILYDYNTLSQENALLDEYVSSIKMYNLSNFNNTFDNILTIGTIKYNKSSNINNIVAITTYKGLLLNGNEINIFSKDIYNNEISTFTDNYYIIADYENNYSFNYFYVVDLSSGKINKLKFKEDISYDSYIQGIVDGKIYLYDKDNENQYEIDIKNEKIKIVSGQNYIKFYNNKKWEKMNKIKANKEKYFNYETRDNNFTNYDYVKETDNYYYLFKKDGISYKLYRVDKRSINVYKYIIDVPVTNISFKNNYLYYVYKNKLYYYSDITGLKTILENSELEFNDTIKYYIY